MNFADQLARLSAAEWKRARDGRLIAARVISEQHARRVLVWAARRAHHEFILRQVSA